MIKTEENLTEKYRDIWNILEIFQQKIVTIFGHTDYWRYLKIYTKIYD